MDPLRAADLAATSHRLAHAAGDLRDRARAAVQGSREVLNSARLARQAREEWTALWPALRALPASRRILSVCGFCRRARAPGGPWTFIPARILDALQARPGTLPLSHGVCPPCLRRHYGMELEDADSAG